MEMPCCFVLCSLCGTVVGLFGIQPGFVNAVKLGIREIPASVESRSVMYFKQENEADT